MNTVTPLPPPLADYLHAINTHDPVALERCFHPDAVARDVAREFRGLPQIMNWAKHEIFAVQVTLELLGVQERDGQTVLKVKVDGTFDRTGLPNPLIMEHSVVATGGRISSLTCQLAV